MIIKMTVHDNDFTEEIEKFCKDLWENLYFGKDDNYENMTLKEKVQWWREYDDFRDMLNPNNDDILTTSQRRLVCDHVKELWIKYVNTHRVDDSSSDEDHTKKYLKKNFKVQVNYQMSDRWENGEVVYYFTTNQKFITQ